MHKIIIADSSCLILLHKIGEFAILKSLFNEVTITPEVASEVKIELPDWIQITTPKDIETKAILEKLLDIGEASAIALAIENSKSLLIIDELKGRNLALEMGIEITGTFGVLILAKQRNIITNVKPILEKIKERNFRFSSAIENYVLSVCKEL